MISEMYSKISMDRMHDKKKKVDLGVDAQNCLDIYVNLVGF
jgi:hypothetical protein